jgi:hypothetical protein
VLSYYLFRGEERVHQKLHIVLPSVADPGSGAF